MRLLLISPRKLYKLVDIYLIEHTNCFFYNKLDAPGFGGVMKRAFGFLV